MILIDKTNLLEEIDRQLEEMEKIATDELAKSVTVNTVNYVRKIIVRQPTAYDVEKVVEQLKEAKEIATNMEDDDFYIGRASGFKASISIVNNINAFKTE